MNATGKKVNRNAARQRKTPGAACLNQFTGLSTLTKPSNTPPDVRDGLPAVSRTGAVSVAALDDMPPIVTAGCLSPVECRHRALQHRFLPILSDRLRVYTNLPLDLCAALTHVIAGRFLFQFCGGAGSCVHGRVDCRPIRCGGVQFYLFNWNKLNRIKMPKSSYSL